MKRSPLRDVATLIRSFYYVAYEGFLQNDQLTNEEAPRLLPFAGLWSRYLSGFFLKAYLETVQGSLFMSAQDEDLQMLLETFLLERAIIDLNDELNNRPDWVRLPLQMMQAIVIDRESEQIAGQVEVPQAG